MSKSPMAPVVYVSETAFLQMLVAAAEVFPHAPGTKRTRLQDGETFGYLFGTASRSHGRLVHRVDFVVPCQRVASRTASSVDPCAIGKKRVTGLIEPFPGLMLLGTFHSHPYDHAKDGFPFPACVQPSEADHASWSHWWDDSPGDAAIELIVAVTELKRAASAQARQQGSCVLGHWGRLKYALGAWHTTRAAAERGDEELLEPAYQLTCPMIWASRTTISPPNTCQNHVLPNVMANGSRRVPQRRGVPDAPNEHVHHPNRPRKRA